MNAAMQQEVQRNIIESAGRECMECLRLAAFADSEPTLSAGIADGMRKLAAYHSENAFEASAKLQVPA